MTVLWVFERKQRLVVTLLDADTSGNAPGSGGTGGGTGRKPPTRVDDCLIDEKAIVFIEIYDFANGKKELPKFNEKSDVLIFLKYYDARKGGIGYAGHLVVPIEWKPRQIMPEMCRRARLSARDDLVIFEEVGPGRVTELRQLDRPLNEDGVVHDMNDGLILVYQLPPNVANASNANAAQPAMPSALDYFTDLFNRVDIEAIEKDAGGASATNAGGTGTAVKKKSVTGQVSMAWTLDAFLQWLGKQIDFDWCKIQLHKPSPYGDRCGPILPHAGVKTFKEVMQQCNSGSFRYDPRKDEVYIVYYAKMPIRIEEMDKRRQIKIQWMDSKFKVEDHIVYPDKLGSVKTILEEVRKLVQLSADGTGQLRLVWTGGSGSGGGNSSAHRVYQVLPMEMTVDVAAAKCGGQTVLRAEEVPADQLNINTAVEHLLPVAHFHKDTSHTFGVPFFIKVSQGEPFSQVKERIKKLLEIPDKEFEKFKFALVVHNKSRYLEDMENCTVNLQELGQSLPSGSTSQSWLGLDHQNKNRGARGHPIEKAIIIHN